MRSGGDDGGDAIVSTTPLLSFVGNDARVAAQDIEAAMHAMSRSARVMWSLRDSKRSLRDSKRLSSYSTNGSPSISWCGLRPLSRSARYARLGAPFSVF